LKTHLSLVWNQTPLNTKAVNGKEFHIYRDKIVLEDDLIGIFDDEVEHEIIRVQQSVSEFTKSNQDTFRN
jgi:hypothetical protein